MNNYIFKCVLDGIPVYLSFRHELTSSYFKDWVSVCEGRNHMEYTVPQSDIDISHARWNTPDNAYTEYSLAVYRVCDFLLSYERCIFHGAAFLWKGKAYLFTAPSGTGKSTQLNNWLDLYENEIEVINGDKPVLSYKHNQIILSSSPWKGKEGMGNDSLSAVLGGIIILEQGKENRIERLDKHRTVPQLLQRILFTVETEELVLLASKMLENIVNTVPVWKLINTGDSESAVLTYETLSREEL